MVPRTEMTYFSIDNSLEQNLSIIREGQFTRYPVAEDNKDNIIGLINLKEVFTDQLDGNEPSSIKRYIRPILHVSEFTPINKILLKM